MTTCVRTLNLQSPSLNADVELLDLEAGKAHLKAKSKVIERTEDKYFGADRFDDDDKLKSDDDEELAVHLNNVHKTYLLGVEGVPALRGVTLKIPRGEFVCIFGTSGGGKTSLLNIIGTIDKPTKGDLTLCGTRVNARTPDRVLADIRLRKMGFVFQTFNLLSSLTAVENVEMPMILANTLSRTERRARAKSLLERVGMGGRLDHLPSQLSGGEQQRVTIARALANEPQILLLDEPTGDLDTVNSAIVMKMLSELNREGISLVMVTHDVSLKWFANRVIWMRDGKIQRIETVADERRKQALAQLDEQLEEFGVNKRSNNNNPNSANNSSNSNQAPRKRFNFQATEMRRPQDYSTHAHLERTQQQQQQQQQEQKGVTLSCLDITPKTSDTSRQLSFSPAPERKVFEQDGLRLEGVAQY